MMSFSLPLSGRRPTTPIATYLRMMYLKRRYKLGCEMLVKNVKGSFTWRYLCHLHLKDRVSDDTTLIKLTRKYKEDAVCDLNDVLALKLNEEKVIRGRKLRIDTTVMEANINLASYPYNLRYGKKKRMVIRSKEATCPPTGLCDFFN